MNDNNKLPKQAKPQEFELIELLFREYISLHIARPNIEYSFQARFQSFINQISSYLHSSGKTGFFTHFFFGSFASLLDTKLAEELGIRKLHFNFDSIDHLRIVAETDDKTHVFIFTENNKNKQQKKDIDFTKNEWKSLKGTEYTDDDNKKLEISVIQINKSIGCINVKVETKDIQDGVNSIKQYNEITKQCIDKDGQYIALEDQILKLSVGNTYKSKNSLKFILEYTKKIHDLYKGLPYGAGAKEADEHGFVAGIFNNFRYRENAHVYLEQFAGKGYADIVLLVRGADRATKSIPIIIEFKAGTGTGTNADDALRQVEEYTKGFQPNNMRILSLSDNILCVGVNLDMPTDSFIQTQVVARDQAVAPLIQQIINQLVTKDILNQNPTPDDLIVIQQTIKQYLEQTYNTFPGTGEKSSAHYMSRFILGESLVLRDYDKHIFIYDKESYIPTATVLDDHNTRSSKKPRIDKILDGSNAVNSILFIPISSADSPVILVNIIDVNRDIIVNNIRLDSGLIGDRKIVQLNIQFNIDKYKESFKEYCNIQLLKIYASISEYNQASIQVKGKLHLVAEDVSDNLSEYLQQAISSQEGLVIAESRYKKLLAKVGEIVYPIKSLIGKESEFQGLLEGIFKYHSDAKLSEGFERRELVLTEFQTGVGGRIDMLVQVIGSSDQGTKEYTPVGLELKYDNTIYLRSSEQGKSIQEREILLNNKAESVIEKLLHDQIERYKKGTAIKSITDGNKVAIMGVVFNVQAQDHSSLLLTTDRFHEAEIVHSSKLYSVGTVGVNTNDLLKPDSEYFMPDWIEQEVYNTLTKTQGNEENLLSLFNKELDDNQIKQLKTLLKNDRDLQSIDGLDLSFNKFTATGLKELVDISRTKLIYLDLSDNDLATDNFADLEVLIRDIKVPILKIADIGMDNLQVKKIIELLTAQDSVSHLEIQHLDSFSMTQDTANSIAGYIQKTQQLNYLDVSKSGIDDQDILIIAQALKGQKTLNHLILIENMIGELGANYLGLALSQSSISFIDVSGNPLGIKGMASIVKGLQNSKVEVIKLVNVQVHNPDDQENETLLLNTMQELFSHSQLTSIDISYNNIGNDALIQIFYTLSRTSANHQLKDLSLAGNEINWSTPEINTTKLHRSISYFLTNLCKNKIIRSLDLSFMDIDDKIGATIAKKLEQNQSLISLDLSGNDRIGTRTISALAKTLNGNIYLKYLNLADNELKIEDLKQLIDDGLKWNKDLTHLNLAGNNFSGLKEDGHERQILDLDHQYVDFKNLLRGNGVLKYLNLSNCKLNSKSLESLFLVLKENSSLEVLNVRGNIIDSTIIESIIEALRTNANQGLDGLKVLYIDQGNLDHEVISKLREESLGISVLVDDDVLTYNPNIIGDLDLAGISVKECLRVSGVVKRSISECKIGWDDVDEFNVAAQEERRNIDKIKISSADFLSYLGNTEDNYKRDQLVKLVDELMSAANYGEKKVIGSTQNLVNKLVNNHNVISHLDKVGKISGITMYGMMTKSTLVDLVNGDYNGTAINVGFIAGGKGLAKISEIVSMQGLKLVSEEKLVLGSSLRAAAPFLTRGTSAFVIYDLVNQVKELKTGNKDALVGVIGDSAYLTIDVAEIGVELTEVFGALEGLSSVTGPVGAAVGTIVFVGTDIYFAVKKVDEIDQVIHLTGWEKFKEGWRAFLDMNLEGDLEELLEEKEVNTQLVNKKFEFLRQHSDIQRYVFPAHKPIKNCTSVIETEWDCRDPFISIGSVAGDCRAVTRPREKCTITTQEELDNEVNLNKEISNVKWSRSKPDNPIGGTIFCYATGDYEQVPNEGTYECKNAIGIIDSVVKTGHHTLIDLGKGKDFALLSDTPNIVLIDNGSKYIAGGNQDDTFVLQGNNITGLIYGYAERNIIDFSNFTLNSANISIVLSQYNDGYMYFYDSDHIFRELYLNGINGFIGRKSNSVDKIVCNCNTKYVSLQGGQDEIIIPQFLYSDTMQLQLWANTSVFNSASQGNFSYTIEPSKGTIFLSLNDLHPFHNFLFNYKLFEMQSINTNDSISFSFFSTNTSNLQVNIESHNTHIFYYLSDSTRIAIDKQNVYAIQNSNKSVDEIIQGYPAIADRLGVFLVIRSSVNNETVSIGHGNHEVISNDPFHKSHLVGGKGEDIYVITSGYKELNNIEELGIPETTIYNINGLNQKDTIDLQQLSKQIKRDLGYELLLKNVCRDGRDVLIELFIAENDFQDIKYVTAIRLNDAFKDGWYKKLQVILNSTPMKINYSEDQFSLIPAPIIFSNNTQIIVITESDIDRNTELVVPKPVGQYSFCYINAHNLKNDLIVTNVFDPSIGQENWYSILLSNFYMALNKMQTLNVKFADRVITLQNELSKINDAIECITQVHQYKSDIYSSIFNINSSIVKHHKHRHHHGEMDTIDHHKHRHHHRERREVEDVLKIQDDNQDDILDSRDNVYIASSSSASSIIPIGYNVINWIRDNLSKLKYLYTAKYVEEKRESNVNDVIIKQQDLDISDNHFNQNNDVNKLNHVIVSGLLAPTLKVELQDNRYIDNELYQGQVGYTTIDMHSTLTLINFVCHKVTRVKYTQPLVLNKNTHVDENIKEYTHRLAYSTAYALNAEVNEENLELLGTSLDC